MPLQEFTPEINQDFYNKLARPIAQQGAERQGQARGEALARGLSGDPFEASAVGAARTGTDNALADLSAGIAYQGAGMQREERLRGQSRDWQVEDRNFGAAEQAKNRDLQERLARLGYDFQSDQASTANRRSWQQLPFQLAGAAGAGYLGRS